MTPFPLRKGLHWSGAHACRNEAAGSHHIHGAAEGHSEEEGQQLGQLRHHGPEVDVGEGQLLEVDVVQPPHIPEALHAASWLQTACREMSQAVSWITRYHKLEGPPLRLRTAANVPGDL